MVSRDTREVVVIKNIKSNVIEEAIFILRSESGNNNDAISKEKRAYNCEKGREILLKEAQSIIDSYIKDNKLHIKPIRGSRVVRLFGRFFHIDVIINTALFMGILLLIFLIIRLL